MNRLPAYVNMYFYISGKDQCKGFTSLSADSHDAIGTGPQFTRTEVKVSD